MNEYEMVVMVVFIISLAAVTIAVIAARARSAGAPTANPALDREVATLKARVAVLERIATDKNHRLGQEFERLREG